MTKRALSVFLLLSMLASLTACGGEAAGSGTTDGTADTTAPADESPYDENGYLRDNLPADLDLGGKTVNIYVRGDNLATEYANESTGDIVDDAVYARNTAIEERLNVKLNYFANTGTDIWNERNKYVDTVRSSVMTNDGSIDLAAALSYMAPFMAQEGLFCNLLAADMPYLEFDQPWWSSSLINELAVGDRLYYASGDASLGMVKGMFCFYFNKDLLADYKLEDPYTLVKDGKWTLDKVQEMSAAAYRDINGNTAVDYAADQFGTFVLSVDFLPNFLISSGRRMTERDAKGQPQALLGSEPVMDFFDRMIAFMEQDAVGVSQSNNEHQNIFHEGRALFLAAQFSTAETMRELEHDFGVVPYPKFDAAQKDYLTTSRSTYSAFSIPVTADRDTTAAVLEAMASESYRTTTPAYFESALKVKYSRDDVSSQMFDIIRQSICYEFGIFHAILLDGITTDIRNVISGANKNGWASTWASKEPKFNSILTEFLTDINALTQ